MDRRSDQESWKRLYQYASSVVSAPDAPIPLGMYQVSMDRLIPHLRRYQLLSRLYHRDPALCRMCLRRYPEQDIDALRDIYLTLFPYSKGGLKLFMEILDEHGRRTEEVQAKSRTVELDLRYGPFSRDE